LGWRRCSPWATTWIFDPTAIDEEVPQSTIDKVLKIPYGIQAYDPNGLALEQFNTHPVVLFIVALFSKAAAGLEDYVGNRKGLDSDTCRH
jgi:hypothetical protein